MNLILIGMMGSGKSTVGQLLADRLGMRFVDTDAVIEEMQGLSISRIFELYGESHFRALEATLVEKLSKIDGAILSTGGGLVMNPCNTMLLKSMGKIIYLKATVDQLNLNLSGETDNRPMLKDYSIEVLLKVREPIYENTADIVVDIDGMSAAEVSDIICTWGALLLES